MKTHAVASVVQRAIYATWRKMMSEPILEDDYARGLVSSDPVYAECRECDAEYEVNGRYDYYCAKCKEESK